MRKISLLTMLGLLLLSAVIVADEPRGEDSLPADLESAVIGEAVNTETEAVEMEVENWSPQPEWVARPTPNPTYCPDCQPCTSTAACGHDPHSGASLGVCSPPPNSWCPGTTTSVCICY